MAIRNLGQRSVALLLILFCLDGHLSGADHHPFCLSNCAPVKLRALHINCLLSCDQELAGAFYRAGRRDASSSSYLLGYGGGDEERDEVESIELPFDDVILREPRDRSAFVRIGKRDVSSLMKRRDEFVRIGKGDPRHISRAPFLLSRTYRGLSDADGADRQLLDQPAEIEKRKTVLVPVSGSLKRPSAFVRIGKRQKPEYDEAGNLLVPQPAPSGGNPEYDAIIRAAASAASAADGLYPRADDTPGEQADKKASAFVRIGRGRGAAFVRIGKSEPGSKK